MVMGGPTRGRDLSSTCVHEETVKEDQGSRHSFSLSLSLSVFVGVCIFEVDLHCIHTYTYTHTPMNSAILTIDPKLRANCKRGEGVCGCVWSVGVFVCPSLFLSVCLSVCVCWRERLETRCSSTQVVPWRYVLSPWRVFVCAF